MIWVEVLSALVIWLSAWSLIRRDEWWFRGADFPRLQILALGMLALILIGIYLTKKGGIRIETSLWDPSVKKEEK